MATLLSMWTLQVSYMSYATLVSLSRFQEVKLQGYHNLWRAATILLLSGRSWTKALGSSGLPTHRSAKIAINWGVHAGMAGQGKNSIVFALMEPIQWPGWDCVGEEARLENRAGIHPWTRPSGFRFVIWTRPAWSTTRIGLSPKAWTSSFSKWAMLCPCLTWSGGPLASNWKPVDSLNQLVLNLCY